MIESVHLDRYLKETFGDVQLLRLKRLGAGVQGTGFLAEVDSPGGRLSYVIKELSHEGLGHNYPSDRAAVFLLSYNEYGRLPNHVKAIDVLSVHEDGSIRSISGGIEYFLMMEMAEGINYFSDLEAMRDKDVLASVDVTKIRAIVSYMASIHAVKMDSRSYYYRKIRDTIGHGECLMGVFDSYPDGTLDFEQMAIIEKKCIDWRARLKHKYHRLSQIHGDFHPGNILFTSADTFTLLDRSRGPWGDPADDVTAFTINYVFFSVQYHNMVSGAYLEAMRLFYELYIQATADQEVLDVAAPFYAFRGVVVANPLFYPDLAKHKRDTIFRFINNVLDAEHFDPFSVSQYLA